MERDEECRMEDKQRAGMNLVVPAGEAANAGPEGGLMLFSGGGPGIAMSRKSHHLGANDVWCRLLHAGGRPSSTVRLLIIVVVLISQQ
jgi:hypothetical protein